MKKWLALTFYFFSTFTLSAQEPISSEVQKNTPLVIPSPWKSEIEFGYFSLSDDKSKALSTRIWLQYLLGAYRTSGEWQYNLVYKNDKEDRRMSTYRFQSDYKLGPKVYFYSSFRGVNSRYSSYYEDYTFSAGGGYQIIYTSNIRYEVEFGPGYQYQVPNLDEIGSKDRIFPNKVQEAIFRLNSKLELTLFDGLALKSEVIYVSGFRNMTLDSRVSLINQLNERAAIKVTYTNVFYDRVPQGTSKTATSLSMNVLFNF